MSRHDPLVHPEPLIRQVYAFAAYRIGHGSEAEDVTSETFARAVRARDTYDPRKGTPIAWLFGIARRCLADAVAARELTVAEVPESAGSDPTDDSVRRMTLATAIAKLDEREQELSALRYGADLTARRIAELLGMKANAVEVALHRALAHLRDHLEIPPAALKGSTTSGGESEGDAGNETALKARPQL